MTEQSDSHPDRQALLLSVAGAVAVLSFLVTLFGLGGAAWSVWLVVAGSFSVLSSVEGVPAIVRSRHRSDVKVLLLAVHLGGALVVTIPLSVLVYRLFTWGRF